MVTRAGRDAGRPAPRATECVCGRRVRGLDPPHKFPFSLGSSTQPVQKSIPTRRAQEAAGRLHCGLPRGPWRKWPL